MWSMVEGIDHESGRMRGREDGGREDGGWGGCVCSVTGSTQ